MPVKKQKKADKRPVKAVKQVKMSQKDIMSIFEATGNRPDEAAMLKRRIKFLEKEVKILREVSEVTNKDFALEKVLKRFLEMLMESVEADAGSLLLVDHTTDTLQFTVALGKKGDKLQGLRLKMGEGIAGWVAMTGNPIVTPDAKNDARFNPAISKKIKYKTHNIICVPLKYEDEVLGVIELLNKKRGKSFEEVDLKIIQVFTPYVGIIVKNAQLFLDNQKRIHTLEHLMELTRSVNSTLNMDELMTMVLDTSTDMLNAEAGSILLLNDAGTELYFAAATGAKKDAIRDIRVPIGEGIVGWVARANQPVLITDAQNDPRFFKKADKKTDFRTKSIIAVPLRVKSKLLGVVEVLNKKNGEPFNGEDLGLLDALSNQCAVAIENAKLYANLKQLFTSTVAALSEAIETKDVYTRGHSERVNAFSELIAQELGLASEERERLNLASMLHDIGKIGIDESILRKPSKLTDEEFREIQKHPGFAADILETIPQLTDIVPAVKHHHERFDGRGYPAGLKGSLIPFFARIIAVADTFDAMASKRPYRDPLPLRACLDELAKCSGTQFDPEITAAALKALERFLAEELKKQEKKGE